MSTRCRQAQTGLLLHAYELGILSESDTEKFEIHLLECEHCFTAVEGFDSRAELIRGDATIIKTLHDAVRVERDRETVTQWLGKHFWPDRPLFTRPALLLAVILLMIYPAYLGLTGFRDTSIREVQSIYLVPARSADVAALSWSSGRDGVISFVYNGAKSGDAYNVTVQTEDGAVLMSDASFDGFDEYETGQLIFPAKLMRKGNYRLIIETPGDTSTAGRQTYKFKVGD